MLLCVHIANLNILKIKGRTDLYLKAEIYKKILGVILIIGGLFFGIIGLITSWVLTYLLSYFINAWFCNKLISFSLKKQLNEMLPAFSCTIIAGSLGYYIQQFFNNAWIEMVCGLSLCIVFYSLLSFCFRLKSYL